jgi:hypothetical protein
VTKKKINTCSLYFKRVMIVIYDRNDSVLNYKTIIVANLN